MYSLKINAIAWKSALLFGLISIMAPMAAHAQTVEECYAERDKLQDWIGQQENQNVFEEVQAEIERADLAASEGDGKKCMEIIKDADGAARALGAN